MPLVRRGAAVDSSARRFQRSVDFVCKVATDPELCRTGRLQSHSTLEMVEGAFEELASLVSKDSSMACYLCTNAQTATSLMALGAVAARWALLGGGVVTEERSAASSTTTDAWVKVLTSFGQLLQSWYEAWKITAALQSAALEVVSLALTLDLIPALSRLLASPPCAPAAGITHLRARAAALTATVALCGLSFNQPHSLLPPALAGVQTHADNNTLTGSSCSDSVPQRPVGPAFLAAAAECALFEHACRAACLGSEGPGVAGPGQGGASRSSMAAVTLQLHSMAAEVVAQLGRALVVLKYDETDEESDSKLEEEEASGAEVSKDEEQQQQQQQQQQGNRAQGDKADGRPQEGQQAEQQEPGSEVCTMDLQGRLATSVLDNGPTEGALRSLRHSVRQILSGTCLQYFLAAHVACQLHAADGGGLYGLPEGAELQELQGCAADCVCSGKVRSNGLLGSVRCWLQAQAFQTSRSGAIEMAYDRIAVHAVCMRLAVVCMASHNRDLEESGSGARRRGKEVRGAGPRGPRPHGDEGRQEGGLGAGELGVGWQQQQPWERVRLRSGVSSAAMVCLESLLAAAAALPYPPIRWHGSTDESHDDDNDGGGGGEVEERGEEVGGGEPAEVRRALRRWWAVAVPAVHAALDDLATSRRGEVTAKTLRRVLCLPRLPLLEPVLPNQPPAQLTVALKAGYLPCLERVLRAIQSDADTGPLAAFLLTSVDSWRRTARLLAYGDVRQAAGLVVTVGKLLLRLSRHAAGGHGDLDEQGRPKPLWLKLGVMSSMLSWVAWRQVCVQLMSSAASSGHSSAGGGAGGQATEVQEAAAEEPGPRAGETQPGAAAQQLQQLTSLALSRWLPHVAAFALITDQGSAPRAGFITLLWVPPLVHAYARAVDAGDSAAAAAWRALLLYDMDVLAVLRQQMRSLLDGYSGGDGQEALHTCGAGACAGPGQSGQQGAAARDGRPGTSERKVAASGAEVRQQPQVDGGDEAVEPQGVMGRKPGFHPVDELSGRAAEGVELVRWGMVRGGGEDGAVEEFRSDCSECCAALSHGLWAVHCVAAALPGDMAGFLVTPGGRDLLLCVQDVAGPQGVAPRPRLLQLLEKLAAGGSSGSGGASWSSSCIGGRTGGCGLAAAVPDPALWEGAWASLIAQHLLPPHSVCAALGVRLCGNPRCEALSGGSELAVPLGGACTRCRAVWYCGRGCQAAHWRAGGHREVCAVEGVAAGEGGRAG